MDQGVKKILIVDDDRNLVQVIEEYLIWKGFKILKAHNGQSALEQIASERPELALCDLLLPDLPGQDLVKKIKELNEDIGVIIITGHGGEQVAVDLMKAGALDFISKPFEMETLFQSVQNALNLQAAHLEERKSEGRSTLENFFPFLAHEIRNPLHAIGGALAIIERKSDLTDQALAQSVRIVKEEIQHLSNFVQECLDFVRPPVKSSQGEVDLNGVLSVILKVVSYMFKGFPDRIKIITYFDPKLPKVNGNYEEIKQAFLNIIKNSCEAIPEKGTLTLRSKHKSEASGDWVEISVKDTGGGIKKENLQQVGTPFFTTKMKGTGLGMAICKKIICDRHQGNLRFDSEEGKGTTVTVTLPVQTN